MRLRATLVNLATQEAVAQETFSTERPAAPDAAGAAAALAQASRDVLRRVLDWARQNVKNGAAPLPMPRGDSDEYTLQQNRPA
jgi:ABC-type uncharacterized transport system auxiliary subunit